jgi:putative ABC transport system substrate-binding protein
MRRRDFIVSFGIAAWPLGAHSQQQSERMRRVGVLMNGLKTDAEIVARLTAFQKAMQELGWTSDANLRVEIRFGVDNDDLHEKAKDLVGLAPDVVLAMAPPSVMALRKVNRTVPIVFVAVTDPIGLGIVQDLAHPGGNTTGFLSTEFGFGAKWLELLKEVAPGIRKVLVITDPNNPGASGQFAAIQTIAPSNKSK